MPTDDHAAILGLQHAYADVVNRQAFGEYVHRRRP